MTRVLLTATSYPRSEEDWQGIFIRRMCDALAKEAATQLRVWAPPGPLDPRAGRSTTRSDAEFLHQLQNSGGIAHLLRRSRLSGARHAAELLFRLRMAIQAERRWAQVLHVNWLQCVIATAGSQTPVLATVLGSDLALLEKRWIRLAVKSALRARKSVICPNAEWMVPVLQHHLGDKQRDIRYVPFGLDPFWYQIERAPVTNRNIWLTVLRVTPRKIGALFEWTRDVDHQTNEFHLFGPMQEHVEVPPWIHYHGAVTPTELATAWYPKATGMITLSRHDEGRPQVLLEAMAAGLPVLCSRTSAHADLCEANRLGALVSTREEFLAALRVLSDREASQRQGAHTRDHISRAFGSWQDCAGRYAAIHEELAGEAARCA